MNVTVRSCFWTSRLRPLPFALLVGLGLAQLRKPVDTRPSAADAALASELSQLGVTVSPEDVAWVKNTPSLGNALCANARALVRIAKPNEPADLYLVEARLSPEGSLLEVGASHRLTETASVDEGRPVVAGRFAAYLTTADPLVTAIHLLDIQGREQPGQAEGFSALQRFQIRAANWQMLGQPSGVVHHAFAIEPPAREVKLSFEGSALIALVDGKRVRIDATNGAITEGGDQLRATLDELSRPPEFLQWGADRMRAAVGDERTQWVKTAGFTAIDWFRANVRAKRVTAESVQDELGALPGQVQRPSFTDPEVGWPPAPIKPLFDKPLPGEGAWIVLDRDPFISEAPGLVSPFITTFIRPNVKRPDLRVFATVWDPRQIATHMESGTVEPVSSTGERGPGLIPRTPERMRRVVAAFNGGFQAQHGEFGMQANDIMYLPPKPYGATVMELKDGSTAFGTWPPGADVPTEVLSLRQNLTPMIEFERFNPWNRTWWGGTPPGWSDNIHTARSAVCLTKENNVGYFWSMSISPDDLAAAMLAARCTYALHLDMNPGHAGFEFYNVRPAVDMKPLGRPMQPDWEGEGKVSQMPDWAFRARRMIRGMGHMNFPRYIQREGRDFFYLTARTILPGANLPTSVVPREPGEGEWRVKGLPQHGFPYAIATTTVRPDAAQTSLRVRVLRVDPRMLKVAKAGDPNAVLTIGGTSKDSGPALWLARGEFAISEKQPPGGEAVLRGSAASITVPARAVVGLDDDEGMLTWIELPRGHSESIANTEMMINALDRMGCKEKLIIPLETHALLGATLDLAGETSVAPTHVHATLARGQAPGAHLMFEDTALVPFNTWHPLQVAKTRLKRAK